jgi:chromate reductase
MIYVLSGTNRPGSRTLQVSKLILENIKRYSKDAELMDLASLPFHELTGAQYSTKAPAAFQAAIDKVDSADGLLVVTPEYNGSMPGALKYFIDHWSYPKSFESRPVAFVGLGFRWGGLRPVEHLQQVFNYRNAYIFPERVFLTNITSVLVDGKITDESISKLIDSQAKNFVKFIEALKAAKLHASTKTL